MHVKCNFGFIDRLQSIQDTLQYYTVSQYTVQNICKEGHSSGFQFESSPMTVKP